MTDAFDDIIGGLEAPRARTLALALTPVVSARALAGLASIGKVSCTVLHTDRGAIAARVVETDPFASLTGEVPDEARGLAVAMAALSRTEVVLVLVRLAGDADTGLGYEGSTTAYRVSLDGLGEQVEAGLLLGNADPVLEDIVVGEVLPEDFPGALQTDAIERDEAIRMVREGTRRRGS